MFRTNNWNVHWDEHEQLFKCWYQDLGWDYDAFMNMEPSEDNLPHWDFFKTADNRCLYAESGDGVHWEKPELDYRSIDGRKTNICMGNEEYGQVHACSVLPDPFETDKDRRYKAVYWTEKGDPQTTSRIATAHSPDGRVWTPYDTPLRIGFISQRQLGDVIILSADTVTGEYHLDTRARGMGRASRNPKHDVATGWGGRYYPNDPWRMSKRRIFSSNSRDINNWPMLREMLVPDDVEANLDDEFYSLTRFRMGDLHVAFLDIFHATHNTVTFHLLYSRDGFHWESVDRGQPVLDLESPRANGTATWWRSATGRCSWTRRYASTTPGPATTTTGGCTVRRKGWTCPRPARDGTEERALSAWPPSALKDSSRSIRPSARDC